MKYLSLILCIFLISCSMELNYRIETLAGYAPEVGDKQDTALLGIRHVAETSIGDSSFSWGVSNEILFGYTEDALEGHNYDLWEPEYTPKLVVSYFGALATPYIALGPTFRWLEADSNSVSDEEIQVDVRAGVRFLDYTIEYRGTYTDYMVDIGENYCISGWINSFLVGVEF